LGRKSFLAALSPLAEVNRSVSVAPIPECSCGGNCCRRAGSSGQGLGIHQPSRIPFPHCAIPFSATGTAFADLKGSFSLSREAE